MDHQSANSTMHATSKKLLGGEELMDKADIFMFDCDGVIWRGDTIIPGVGQVLDRLRALGKRIFFVTNNSTKSRQGVLKKFLSLGLNVHAEEIFSSSFAAAAYLQQLPLPQDKKVYVIGQEGICDELDLMGIPNLGGPADNHKVPSFGPEDMVHHDPSVGAVVVGLDVNFNYYKLQYAQLCINENPGCLFIATNLDATAHLTNRQEWACGGAMVGALKGCTSKEPILVGKPSPLLIDHIVAAYGVAKERICMVGDRLDTDILFGQRNGLHTVLTLSGVTTKEQLFHESNATRPDYYVESIVDFFV